MPRLMIDLTGVEYDRLCEMARRERRTPQAQAAVVIGTTMAALAGEIALEPTDRSPEAQGPPGPALPPQEGVRPVQAGRDGA
jgi:hypothetical protein